MKKKRPMLLTIGALLVVGGGVGGYLASRSGSAGPGATGTQAAQQAAAPAGGAATQTASQPAAGGTQPSSPVTPTPTTGHVTVSGLPRGATVLIDGQRKQGNEFELAPGQHQVRVETAGYEPFSTPITVEAGVRTQLPVTLARLAQSTPVTKPASPAAPPPTSPVTTETKPPAPAASTLLSVLRISVQPPANLSINSVNKGQLARIVDTLPPGTHLLHFERDGYLPLDTAVILKAGQTATLLINLVSR